MKRKHIFTALFAVLFITIVALVLLFRQHTPELEYTDQIPVDTTASVPRPVPTIYGLEVDTFNVISGTVKSGDSFGKIMNHNGLPHQKVFEVAQKIDTIFNIAKIRTDKRYTILKGENASQPSYFIYENNLLHYTIIALGDSVFAKKGARKKSVVKKERFGTISSSLSATLNNVSLTNELSGIYAWTIDFFRIQKGDSIAVIYEEIYVDDTIYAGIGKILSARFVHFGEDYFAFRYTDPDQQTDYFDETGRSLRKAFLKAPLQYSRISSRYTQRRFHPVQKRWKAHLGTDYAAPTGTPIMSTADGVVSKAGYTSGNGNYVKVRHNSVYSTQYLHMSKIGRGIKTGVRVKQGDVIGYVGSTGLATGPHVCYRFWKNGKQVDPYKQKLPDANPINEKFKADFLQSIEQPMRALMD